MDRSVVVTGACGGIGRAVSAAFAEAGWYVIGVDLREPDDDRLYDRFEFADVSAEGEVEDLFGRLSGLDRLDALVNNAAVQVNKPIVQTTDDDWAHIVNTNVRSAFQCIREAHDLLQTARGAVVNVSSVHAIATSVNVAVYAISKGALVALTRSAALELAVDGIRCNAVLPGAVDTPMLRAGLARREHPDGPDGNLAELVSRTPIGFVATPEQIAPTVVHLADTEQTPYITGQMIVMDGGATIRLGTE